MKQRRDEELYRLYMSEMSRAAVMGLSAFSRSRIDIPSYAAMIDGKPKDTRTGDEIAVDVIRSCGLTVVHEEIPETESPA